MTQDVEIVIDCQNTGPLAGMPRWPGGSRLPVSSAAEGIWRLGGQGQREGECGAPSRPGAASPDTATMGFHDSFADRQPQAGAAAAVAILKYL